MYFFPNSKTFLEISFGSVDLHIQWYSILILSGAILAYTISVRAAKKLGYDKEVLEDFFFTMLPLAIIGARIYYCIFEWQIFMDDPIRVFYIWEGGLAIHGGIIVGILYAFFYFRYKGINLLRVGDCIMPNVLIAQVIGRWGNFINQEAYGQIVSEDYFTHFPHFIKEQMYIGGNYRQPMFLYEGIGNLIGFIVIKTVFKKYGYKKRGDMIYAYITWYGIVRFFVECFRSDALLFLGLKVAQLISILFILIGVLGLIGVYDKLFKQFYPFKKEKPIVLFDADGTLVDSEKLIKESFVYTFKHYLPNRTFSEEELQSFLGPALKDTFTAYLPDHLVDEAVEYYRVYNHQKHDEEVKGMIHAKELIEYLKEQDYTVGVVSNKMTPLVKRGLKCAEIEDMIDVVVGRDQIENSKPNPEGIKKACELAKYPVDDIIYVGDAPGDILAAKNIGAYSVGFANDESNYQRLAAVKPNCIISDLLEIKDIVKEDHKWNVFVI